MFTKIRLYRCNEQFGHFLGSVFHAFASFLIMMGDAEI
jgi:hypothetical protein